MNNSFRLIAASAVLSVSVAAGAAPISTNTIPYQSLVGPAVSFDTVTAQDFEGILDIGPAMFAERFVGQPRSYSGNFDVLGTGISGPLALAAGAPGANLAVYQWNGGHILLGMGWLGQDLPQAIGEGSIAALFAADQSAFGFEFIGVDGGSATLHFFRRDGALIDAIVLQNLVNGAFVFSRGGGAADIAGFSLFNDDPDGIAIDNLRFTAQLPPEGLAGPEPPTVETVPEPSVLALLALAGAFLGARRRAA